MFLDRIKLDKTIFVTLPWLFINYLFIYSSDLTTADVVLPNGKIVKWKNGSTINISAVWNAWIWFRFKSKHCSQTCGVLRFSKIKSFQHNRGDLLNTIIQKWWLKFFTTHETISQSTYTAIEDVCAIQKCELTVNQY